jgi:hypothetical protein
MRVTVKNILGFSIFLLMLLSTVCRAEVKMVAPHFTETQIDQYHHSSIVSHYYAHEDENSIPLSRKHESEDDDKKEEKEIEEELNNAPAKKKKLKVCYFQPFIFSPTVSSVIQFFFDLEKIDAITYLYKAFLISETIFLRPFYIKNRVFRC